MILYLDDFDENKNCEKESKIQELRLQEGGERCSIMSRGELGISTVPLNPKILIIARKRTSTMGRMLETTLKEFDIQMHAKKC